MPQAAFVLDGVMCEIVRKRRACFQVVRFASPVVADDLEAMAIVSSAERNESAWARAINSVAQRPDSCIA
jgi:hypothetical protein